MTAGMVHLGERARVVPGPRRPPRAARRRRAGRDHRAPRAVGPGVGVQPGGGEDRHRRGRRRGRAVLADAEAVAVLASPDHEAYGMGMFLQLPQTMDALDRLPESFRTGLGFDYDTHGPEAAVGIERGFEPWNRAHFLPDVLPLLDGVADKLAAGALDARRRVRHGRGGADGRRCVPGLPVDRLRHLPPRPGPGRGAQGRGAARPTPSSTTRVADPLPTDRSARPRHDVRLHPRHDRPAVDDGGHPRRRRRRRHVAARRHQGPRHLRPRTPPRTRWRR